MVRWMCRVWLKDRKRSVDLYSLLGVQCGGCCEQCYFSSGNHFYSSFYSIHDEINLVLVQFLFV